MNEATLPITTSTLSWRAALLLILALLLLLVLAQWQVASDIADIWWRSKTFNHCLIIPLISGWLIWQRREELASLSPQPGAAGLLLLAAAALLQLLADLAGIAAAGHFALILGVQALIWLVLGTAICRRLLFPLLYLWFAVPFGEFLVPQLQDVTADMAVYLLRVFDIPVFRDGHFIALPNGDFLVEEACSGINYLIASLALGTLFAYLQYRSYWRRAAFIGLSIVVPIVANGVRAFGIILTAHLTNNEYAVGVDHLIYGWVFFGVVMFLLFALGRSFADEGPQPAAAADSPAATRRSPTMVLLLAALLVMAGSALLTRQPNDVGNPRYAAAPLPAPWRVQNQDRLGVQLVGAASQLVFSDGEVEILLGYFPADTRDHELVNAKHRLYEKTIWRRLHADQRLVAAVNADGLRLGNVLGEAILVHTLYLFSDSIEGPAWQAKWHQMQARITQQSAPALYLVIARSAALADSELDRRLGELLPVLQQNLHAHTAAEAPLAASSTP